MRCTSWSTTLDVSPKRSKLVLQILIEPLYGIASIFREHADRAISILKSHLPDNHLLLASCQRVKALILEEVAIDSQDKNYEATLLQEAEDLHLSALSVCKRLFGENNIQTAKHYGNLGRLYQSLRRYEVSGSFLG